jgi:thiamine transport system ATP-binding protein
MLVADALRFAHPGQTSPYQFSLSATQGEITAISGPSGSGKSTFLDLIAGFLQPQSGSLTLDGRDLLPLPPEQRPVSLLLQGESLFEHLSARRNVELGLPAPTPGLREKAEAALARLGLDNLGTRPAADLSGGQKQRVALARTLLRGKPVLLLDEPFSALDDDTRKAIRTLVGELTRSEGWITLLVTHAADDIAALAKRHYRIVDGQLNEVSA